MAVKLAPIFNDAQFISGIPATGALLFTYAAGSSTKQTTYTSSTGLVAQSNPIVLNSRGEPANPIWLTSGLTYKFVFAPSTDSDPPVAPIRTIDNISGINDTTVTISEWVDSGLTPTYVSGTQFTVPGDQTSAFAVNRRAKFTVTAGTVYGYISVSSYAALTTVTVVLDSGALDAGLSAVQLGLLTPDNPSSPILKDNNFRVSGSTDKTKRVALEVDGLTTATTRTMTIPDKSLIIAGTVDVHHIQGFRLTLTSGLPITTADVTGATTIYATPYKSSTIGLYDGSVWNMRASAEFSVALGTITASRPYDVFCYDNAGVPTLEILAWTNDTTRATALVYQDGVLVKSGATTRRYLGTFYTTSTTQTEDSTSNRYLWNYDNRVGRRFSVNDTTDTWTYTTATWRQARATATNKCSVMIGVLEDLIDVSVQANAVNSTGNLVAVGIGIDSTSVNSAQIEGARTAAAATGQVCHARYLGYPLLGQQDIVWLEISEAGGTTTWYGDGGVTYISAGMIGSVMA